MRNGERDPALWQASPGDAAGGDDLTIDFGNLLTELRERRMPVRRSYFIAYFINFARKDLRSADEAARDARANGWDTAQYGAADGQVVRLSRRGLVSPERLQDDRLYIRGVTRARGGRLVAWAIEDLQPRAYSLEITNSPRLQAVPPMSSATTRSWDGGEAQDDDPAFATAAD